MRFSHRLAYYLFGFLIGGLFLKFVLDYTGGKGMDFTYLPNARVLKNIRNKPFEYSEKASSTLAETWIDTIDIKNTLTYGDVDFDKSNIKYENGKLYCIEGNTIKNQPIILTVINYSGKAVLKEIKKI